MSKPDEQQVDVIHHLLDSNTLEFFNVKIALPLQNIHLFGIDISITKHVLMIWIVAAVMLILFPIICNRKSLVPKGLRNMFEAILLFIRDDIAYNNMEKEEADRYLPYLWTLFFFILFCNLLGLVPFAATATNNIAVTATLAAVSFFFIHFSGIRKNGLFHYMGSIVPHVPILIWPLMLIVEVIGHIVKPCALAIRLFANMMAGHIIIPVILGFIFLVANAGIFLQSGIIAVSLISACLLMLLEIFIAFLQAYIFTFLTAVFMGMAIHPQH